MRNPQPNWASSLHVTNMGLGNHCDSLTPPPPNNQKPRNKHKTTSYILPKCKKKSRKKQQNCVSFKKPRVVPVTSPTVAACRLCGGNWFAVYFLTGILPKLLILRYLKLGHCISFPFPHSLHSFEDKSMNLVL